MTPPSQDATDIFSLSDHALADRLQFIKEVGSCQLMLLPGARVIVKGRF